MYLLSLTPDYQAAGEPQQITHEDCCLSNPLWTAAGREILYLKRDTDITAMYRIKPVAGAESRPVTTIGTLGSQVSISPQGDKLIYVSGAMDSDLWRVELPSGAGQDRVLTPIRILPPAASTPCSADGKRVAFCSNRQGCGSLGVRAFDGGRPGDRAFAGAPNIHPPDPSGAGLHPAADFNRPPQIPRARTPALLRSSCAN